MSDKVIFVFDMDGTLTPPAAPMFMGFASFFAKWIEDRDVRIISGSPIEKMRGQLPKFIMEKTIIYPVSGNQTWRKGVCEHLQFGENGVIWPGSLLSALGELAGKSTFKYKAGAHIDFRYGMLNFCPPGRGMSHDQRQEYVEYDGIMNERNHMVDILRRKFGDEYDIAIGGQISIDITPTGANKAQILDEFPSGAEIIFFGDKCEPGQNDYPLAEALAKWPWEAKVHKVKNSQNTERILRDDYRDYGRSVRPSTHGACDISGKVSKISESLDRVSSNRPVNRASGQE